MTPRHNDRASGRSRIIKAAYQLAHTADLAGLSMRDLASKAGVSLRTAYNLFGSKQGVTSALLLQEQTRFRREFVKKRPKDPLQAIFYRVRLAVRFYCAEEVFYRTVLSRPGRDIDPEFTTLLDAAITAGYLQSDFHSKVLAEHISEAYASAVQLWATGVWNGEELYNRLCYGFAVTLAGVATPEATERLRRQALGFQRAIERSGSSRGGLKA